MIYNTVQIEESKILDKVIQWGKEQTPNLPSDHEQWNDENFLALKTTFSKCIPLIRYFQMPGKDIEIKVKPYRQILGSNLWDDIALKIMTPDISVSSTILPARKKITVQLPVREVHFVNSSSIIINEHFAEISSWIDRRPSKYDITKYLTSLIYFLEEINGTNEILGGYNPLVWTSDDSVKWSKTHSLPNSILSRIIDADYGIGCYSSYGPVFGGRFYMINDVGHDSMPIMMHIMKNDLDLIIIIF
ncbi:hypothetical protein C2G38_2044380 [Gigaspora rosea]|uniref:TLDc domain-containing protein n=1 Tax=Gigaspora rosea TaxID=44941 RepID=A0A397UPN4_9GLOM|nr:hypothetical protein C2G38_2044380 [Gigaspora rosea]